MANSKDIELAIKARDLASKPLQDIGAAVDKLVSAVGDLVPASEKGAKNLSDLTSTAGQLQKAMQGLKADAALVESFAALSTKVEEAGQKLKTLQETADAAKLSLANSAEPTKAMQAAADSAATAATRQATALGKLTTQLENLKGKASAVGIDFNDLAGAQSRIDAAFNAAQPAYARVNEAIDQYAANQRKAAVAAQEAAAAAGQVALKEKAQATAAAEATAMEQRFTESMRQQGSAAAEAAKQHGGLLQSFISFRGEGGKAVELYKDLKANIIGLTAQFAGFFGAIEAVKSGFESIEKLEGTKSILSQTFGADGAGQQLDYVRGQADRLSLSYVELARNYAKFSSAAAGNGTSQEQTRQIFETFAEAARVKNLSAEQQASVFQALDKIFAKDAVGATELFRKLSTDLPEAAAIFRKSIDTLDGTPLTTDQFERLLKSGKITADFVAKFAADYRASFADQLPAATNTTTAALAKFNNAWDAFKIDVLEGGALDAFKDSLDKVSVFFKSDDGRKFASDLGQGAKAAAQGLGLIADNVNAIELALGILSAVWAANVGKAFLADLAVLCGKLDGIAQQINTALKAAPLLSQALALAAGASVAAFEGFKIGTWLNDNIAGVRQFGVLMVGYYVAAFTAIKETGKAAFSAIFTSTTFKDATDNAVKNFQATIAALKDQYNEAGKEPGAAATHGESAASGPGAATATAMTPQQRADAALAAQKALNDELLAAATSLQTKLSEMRGALLKKDATDLKGYLAGLSESFKPLYAEIDKLKQDFPHNSQALVDKLTAQLNSIKSLTLTDAANKFNEDKAKRDLEEINALLRERDQLISNQSRKASEGIQSPEQAQRNIAGITASSNPAILESVTKLQGFISTLPAAVQAKLQATSDELKLTLDKLEERPATNVLKDIKAQEEAINQALELRNTKLEAVKQQTAAGLLTTQQEKSELVAINGEYGKTIDQAKALIGYIQTSADLTDDQRKALEGVVAKLEIAVASAKQYNAAIYPATKVAEDIAQGGVNIAAAFAKASAQGRGLGGAFTSAWQAFKSFASDFLLKIGEMIIKTEILNALGYGGASGSGGAPGVISSLIQKFAGGAGAAAGAAAGGAASSAAAGSLDNAILAGVSHGGGIIGASGRNQHVLKSLFDGAARMHTGGTVGLSANEVPIIAERGERMLSRAQVAAGIGGPSQAQHIQVINGIDHEDIVRRGLGAPSNTKVILNMIRANRSSVRQALA